MVKGKCHHYTGFEVTIDSILHVLYVSADMPHGLLIFMNL